MKLAELFRLRELFWGINRQELVVFQKLIKGEGCKGFPSKTLEGVDKFLRNIEQNTDDPDLKADVQAKLKEIAEQNANPFALL